MENDWEDYLPTSAEIAATDVANDITFTMENHQNRFIKTICVRQMNAFREENRDRHRASGSRSQDGTVLTARTAGLQASQSLVVYLRQQVRRIPDLRGIIERCQTLDGHRLTRITRLIQAQFVRVQLSDGKHKIPERNDLDDLYRQKRVLEKKASVCEFLLAETTDDEAADAEAAVQEVADSEEETDIEE